MVAEEHLPPMMQIASLLMGAVRMVREAQRLRGQELDRLIGELGGRHLMEQSSPEDGVSESERQSDLGEAPMGNSPQID